MKAADSIAPHRSIRAPILPRRSRRPGGKMGNCKWRPPENPHMLRHSTGYKLANDGHDTRALQHTLGHKNIQTTMRDTKLSAARFNDSWEDQRATRMTSGLPSHIRGRLCHGLPTKFGASSGHSSSGQLSHQSNPPALAGTWLSSGPQGASFPHLHRLGRAAFG